MKTVFNFTKLIALLLANKSASFANISSYTTSTGKVYKNLRINLNVSSKNLKSNWLKKLLAYDLKEFNFKDEPIDEFALNGAYGELIDSARNALKPFGIKNKRAKGAINAYNFIEGSKSIATCENTESVKLFGTFISGEIVEMGIPKSLGKAQKVRYKRMLEKQIGQTIRLPWTLEKVGQLNCFKNELNF